MKTTLPKNKVYPAKRKLMKFPKRSIFQNLSAFIRLSFVSFSYALIFLKLMLWASSLWSHAEGNSSMKWAQEWEIWACRTLWEQEWNIRAMVHKWENANPAYQNRAMKNTRPNGGIGFLEETKTGLKNWIEYNSSSLKHVDWSWIMIRYAKMFT